MSVFWDPLIDGGVRKLFEDSMKKTLKDSLFKARKHVFHHMKKLRYNCSGELKQYDKELSLERGHKYFEQEDWA
ncbi:hypothetical protein Dimus_037029 [Dionaea muscipula]